MNNPQEKKMQIRTYAGGVLTMAPTREKVQFLSWTFSFLGKSIHTTKPFSLARLLRILIP